MNKNHNILFIKKSLGECKMKINDKVIRLDCTKGSYAYAVIGNDGITLIDTSLPNKGEGILSELATYNIKPTDIKRILLTHHDVDHIGNTAFLQDKTHCDIYIDPNDYPYIMEGKSREGIKKIASAIIKVQKPTTVRKINENKIGEFIVIPASGHTKGHTVYQFENILFIGDLATSKNGKITNSPSRRNWNNQTALNSIKELSVEGIDWLCMAHSELIEPSAWNEFIKTLK